jgi:hypothetical protein
VSPSPPHPADASARRPTATSSATLRMPAIVANDRTRGSRRHGRTAAATAAAVRRPWSTHAGMPMPS